MNPDLIVVHVGNTIGDRPLIEAARRAWQVADVKAADLKWLVAVTARSEVAGIFEIVGYNSLGKDSTGRNRVEFDLVPSDAKLVKSLTGRVVQGNIRAHSSEYLTLRADHHPDPQDYVGSVTRPHGGSS